MKRRYILPLLLSCALLPSLVSCYGNNEIEKDGIFRCSTKDDCIGGYTCDRTTKFCVEETVSPNNDECIDDDGDGFGPKGLTATQRASCRECRDRRACDPDPDDTNPSIYPGAVDFCDGVDNNGDGNTDKDFPCKKPKDCSLDSREIRAAILKNISDNKPALTDAQKEEIKNLLDGGLVATCNSDNKCEWSANSYQQVVCVDGVPKVQ